MMMLKLDSITGDNNFVVHKNEHFTVSNGTRHQLTTQGSFSIDPWLGRDTSFGMYVADTEDHLIR